MRGLPSLLALPLLAPTIAAQGTPSDLAGAVQDGQVFLTWTEVAGSNANYRVYRSGTPISSPADLATASLLGEVGPDSSENVRDTQLLGTPTFFRIVDLGPPLSPSEGVFVYTVAGTGDGHYAVTGVVGGVEDTTIVVGENSLAAPVAEAPAPPRPVLQNVQGSFRHYVHWVSSEPTPFAPAMWNAPSRAFNLRVVYDPSAATAPRPVLLALHARGGNYRNAGADAAHPEAIVLSPDDWIGVLPTNTFWYGMNAAFPNMAAYPGSLNVDYTVQRVMAELDFVLADLPADPERVYVRGSSMGGVGAVFFCYRFPDRFAAAHAVVPKFDFGCSANGCWLEPQTGTLLWGAVAQNLPTNDGIGVYDRLDLGFLATPAPDLPLITTFNGRFDVVVGWPEKPPTYAVICAARQPGAFFWDDGTHGGPNGTGSGEWAAVIAARRNELWQYRIHQAMPGFANLSLDDDPGDGDPLVGDAIGTINGYLGWDVPTIEDTADHHSLVVRLRAGPGLDAAPAPSGTVDWTPRRLQSFPRVPGQHVRFKSLEQPSGTLADDRVVTADADGLATVTGATITTAGNLYRLDTIDLSVLPALLATGLVHPGGFVSLNAFGSPASPTYLVLGLTPASFSIPGISGTVEIADPLLVGAGAIGADGKTVFTFPLDPSLAPYVGVSVRFQALVGLAVTNAEVVTLQP